MANQEEKKLTYEQLKAYAEQAVTQAKKLYEENQELKKIVQDIRIQMNYADLNNAFKVLEYKDLFAPEFVQKVIDRLTAILTPQEEEEEKKDAENTELTDDIEE